jgi:hypothetical protein
MAYAAPLQPVASAARTTSGSSGPVSAVDAGGFLSLLVNVSSVSGTTPSLALSVEWSMDGGTTFAAADVADTFTAITAAKTVVGRFAVKAPIYRVVWTITGTTPSFTFDVRSFVTA